jgi:nitrogen fixation/metabolism regulation signal transduction histidine kinase
MTIFKVKTLPQYIRLVLGLCGLLFLIMAYLLLAHYGWQLHNISLALVVLTFIGALGISTFERRILSTYNRAMLHLEAVKVEDYTQFAKSEFAKGITANFHQELHELSDYLQAQKSQYDQHAMLLYQLIDQLDTPVLVFNKKQKLTYANTAFAELFGQPWQMFRFASPKFLGLERNDGEWEIKDKPGQWHISQSEFIDSGERHQLMVFTNIDAAIRASQLSAWQQIIRVLGHEIRNSLTPVSSLAESLATKLETDREKQALSVISERCIHLQDFVNRYSSLSQKLNLNIENIELERFIEKLKALFPDHQLNIRTQTDSLQADSAFIEQVFINLIKNAYEAGASQIDIHVGEKQENSLITIIDDGQGFANTDNLFVPLFTTKQQGQGIGLTFCRNIIEQHGGNIALTNNTKRVNQGKGVTVVIQLPIQGNS